VAYSCNVPVPAEVSRLARGLAAELHEATPQDRHTLVAKRFEDDDPRALARGVREAIAGLPPFAARMTGVDVFYDPPTGTAPVAYLAVESPGLHRLHAALCERFDPVGDIEGEAYVPHVTIARGGDADRLVGREVDLEWTVDSVVVWSAGYGEAVERISLPA
jgi:2'-5' RNA ligase